ncbi:MAG: bacterial Ig-like domain-containing protein, partial [Firmicutes bacterium]|nr:bacterial Ig-like domain-containing protein [Bacillota bacterium]
MEDKTVVYGETGVKFEAAGAKTSVTYSGNNDNVATVAEDGSVTINGVGEVTVTAAAAEGSNYKAAEKTATLTVSAADISEAEIDPIADVEYTGSAQTPEPVVKLGDKTLVKDTDYTVAYADYINVGKATVTVTGKGNYTGSVDAGFNITKAKAIAENVTVTAPEKIFETTDLADIELSGTTTPEGAALALKPDQELTVGTKEYDVVVTPTGAAADNYDEGTGSVSITVLENTLESIEVTTAPTKNEYVYGDTFDKTGMVVTGTYANGDKSPVTDYTVSPEKLETVGDEVTVTVTYEGKTATTTVKVNKGEQTIEADDFSVVFKSVTDLSKKGFKAEGALSFAQKGEAPEGTTLSDATLTAGETEGTVTITVTAAATENYNEATKDITVTVTAKTPQELSLGDDLEKTYGDEAFALTAEGAKTAVTYKSSDDSVATVDETGKITITAVGEATITATAAEDDTYAAAEDSVKLTVKPADIAGAEIAELESQIYSGKPYEPAVEATFGGKALQEDTDYTVEYKDNTNAGEATVTLTGKGNFTGTNEVTFTIEQADSVVENVKVTAPEEIFESTKMSDVVIEAEYIAPEGGELSLDAGQTLKQGSSEYKWTYIPVDTDNYRNATGTVMIDVLENTLEEVELVTGPALTVYTVGDSFDPEGMIIKATFANGDVIDEVDTSELTFEPETFTEAGEVEVTVTYKDKTVTVKVTVEEPVKYTITLSAGEGGSVKADKEEAAEGETVTITATPKSGYKFDKWTVTSGSAVVAKATSKSTTFTMPAEAVAIEATFKESPSGGGSSSGSSSSEQFKDVPKGTYYHDPVYWAVKKGITEGTSKTTFSPMGATTRGQFVTFLWRAAGKPVVEIDCPFEDIEEDAYYYQAVLWAYKNG